jgi:hypothetical protein
MAKAIPKCPSCNSDNVVLIVLGFRAANHDGEAARRARIGLRRSESMDRWLSQLNFVSTSCSTFPDNPGGFTE